MTSLDWVFLLFRVHIPSDDCRNKAIIIAWFRALNTIHTIHFGKNICEKKGSSVQTLFLNFHLYFFFFNSYWEFRGELSKSENSKHELYLKHSFYITAYKNFVHHSSE